MRRTTLASRFTVTRLIIIIGLIIGWAGSTPPAAHAQEVVCDNKDSCFSKRETAGAWGYIPADGVGSLDSYSGHAYWTYNSRDQALDWGQWKPNLPEDGTYDVYIWYPHFPGIAPETNNAHYRLHHADGDYKFTHDQARNSGRWNKVATVRCRAGTECYLKLTDETSETNATRRVWFDAVKFVRVAPFEPTPDPVHNYTEIWGSEENGKTTIFLKVCGRGEHHRFRSLQLSDNTVLWDETYDALDNSCSRDYRAVINAVPGEKFRFYSAVMNDPLSDEEFLQQRRDSCIVLWNGEVACSQGETVPPIAKPVEPTPVPNEPCSVPFFSQNDPDWKHHPLRTAGQCSAACGTIGACGCTLTSTAMVLRYYGANTNPARLSDCMGTRACYFHWGVAPGCSGGKAQLAHRGGFSWEQMSREINQNGRPVLLGMTRPGGEHWVVVTRGSGASPANYTIHDPWPLNGANTSLNNYAGWNFVAMSVYSGQQPCALTSTVATQDMEIVAPPESEVYQRIAAQTEQVPTSTITGTVHLYRSTGVTMTLALTTNGDENTEMLIWTDTISSTTWQPFAPYVEVPASETMYAQFRDQAGNVSDVFSNTLYPGTSPNDVQNALNPISSQVYLPLVRR